MENIYEYMKNVGAVIDESEFESYCNEFISHMSYGLGNEPKSLKMIPTYLSTDKETGYPSDVIILDAGGTNLRVGLVSFASKDEYEVSYLEKYPVPGRDKEITCEQFFDMLAEYLEPIVHRSDKIGFCFSFPCEILPDGDGKIILFNKEVKVTNAEGKIIGECLQTALKKKGLNNKHSINVINDTVATLLGGRVAKPSKVFDSYIGYILGTGTNSCYIETNANILKSDVLKQKDGSSIINIESGGYAGLPMTEIDKEFDAKTLTPGTQLFEKMVSGAYQGDLYLLYAKKAALGNCFDDSIAKKIMEIKNLESKQLNDFYDYPYGDNMLANICKDNDKARESLHTLSEIFFARAAAFVCINLTAIMVKTNIGKHSYLPVCIAAEGTTFFKSKIFRQKLNYYFENFTCKKMKCYCTVQKVENATITGSAIAGLLA